MHTYTGPMLVILVSMSPYELCSVDSVGHVRLVSPIASDSYNLSPATSVGFPGLWDEEPYGDLQIRVSMFGCDLCTLSHLLL